MPLMRGANVRLSLWVGLGLLTALAAAASAGAAESPLQTLSLAPTVANPSSAAVTIGALDQDFQPFIYREMRRRGGAFWLRLTVPSAIAADVLPAVTVRAGRHLHLQLSAPAAGKLT